MTLLNPLLKETNYESAKVSEILTENWRKTIHEYINRDLDLTKRQCYRFTTSHLPLPVIELLFTNLVLPAPHLLRNRGIIGFKDDLLPLVVSDFC